MYNVPIKFTNTGRFGVIPKGESDVYTIEEFKDFVNCGAFIDYDGFGNPVKNNMSNPSILIKPSKINEIPNDATHIVWYNK